MRRVSNPHLPILSKRQLATKQLCIYVFPEHSTGVRTGLLKHQLDTWAVSQEHREVLSHTAHTPKRRKQLPWQQANYMLCCVTGNGGWTGNWHAGRPRCLDRRETATGSDRAGRGWGVRWEGQEMGCPTEIPPPSGNLMLPRNCQAFLLKAY